MKSIKHFSMFLFAGILSLTMASCYYDEDKDPQKINPVYYKQISGNFTGSAKYYLTVGEETNVQEKEVTTVITADSTIKVTGLPMEGIIKKLDNEDLKTALLAQSNPVLTARFLIYSVANGIDFMVYPENIEFKNVTVGESVHDYKLAFIYPSPSTGYANSSCTGFGFCVYPAVLYEGNEVIQQFVISASNVTLNDAVYIECAR